MKITTVLVNAAAEESEAVAVVFRAEFDVVVV